MRSFQVEVWWDGRAVADVTMVSPLGATTEVITYRDAAGGIYKLPGRQDTSLLRNRSDSSWRNLAATSAHRGDPVVLRSVADRRALAGEPLHLES